MTSCPVTIKKAELRGWKWIFERTDCQSVSLPSCPPPAACQSSCATCSSRLACQSCGPRQPLLGPDSSRCLASCPPGSYQADHTHCRREYHHTPCAASEKCRYFEFVFHLIRVCGEFLKKFIRISDGKCPFWQLTLSSLMGLFCVIPRKHSVNEQIRLVHLTWDLFPRFLFFSAHDGMKYLPALLFEDT